MDTEGITCPVIEFFKGGKLFLQWYIGQITGLSDDLHVMLQLPQPAGNGVKFFGCVGAVGHFD